MSDDHDDGSPMAFDRRAIPSEARESFWTARDGQLIRRIDWAEPAVPPRGSLLFMPGRGDAYEKYLETLAHWNSRGWRVSAADWRGQAGSGRLGLDPVTGHVDDFAVWIKDLAAFWAEWKADRPGPHVIAGHSMGGHIVLRAMAENAIDPAAAVLTAPMLGLHPRLAPAAFLQAIAGLMVRTGDPRRPAWRWSEKPGALPANRVTLLTHDPERYADEVWWRDERPEIVMGPGSWRWIERAIVSIRLLAAPGMLERISVPVLMLATTQDRLVEYGAIERAVRRLPKGELVRFGLEARHEILRETDRVRDHALAAIDDFLDRSAPAKAL